MQRRIRNLTELKENLRAAVDIVQFIGQYVELSQQGKNWFGKCPFHDDSTPSFNVTPHKRNPQGHALGLWSCLGCRKSGDLFRFVEEFEKCSFVEAIEIVAEQANFDLTPYMRELTPEEKFLESAYTAVGAVADLFHEELVRRPDLVAFFAERGINVESLRKFKIGYCPSPRFLEESVEAGLVDLIEPSRERREILFGGHLLYPQFTPEGNVWGWYARTNDKTKYWGPSRDSRLFAGQARLYGLHSAKRLLRTGEGFAVLVEGFHDAIAAQQHGFAAIGVCGTELSAEQIKTLHDHSIRSLVVVFDGDDGGRAGMLRLALRAHEIKDLDLKFVSIPGDPDEFLTQRGREMFAKLVQEGTHAIEYVLVQNENGSLSTPTAQLEFLNRVRPLVTMYPRQSVHRAVAIKALAHKLQLPDLSIEDFFDESLADDPLVSIVGEQVILAELLCGGTEAFVHLSGVRPSWFSVTRHRVLYDLLYSLYCAALPINVENVCLEARNRSLGPSVAHLATHLPSVKRDNLQVHFADVRDKAVRREAEATARQASLAVRDTRQPVEQTLAKLSENIVGLVVAPSRNVLIPSLNATDAAVAQLIERQHNGTSIAGLDLGGDWSHLMGWINGFRGGRVHIVAALSGVGKSIVGLANWVHRLSVASDGPRAAGAVFSLEMSAIENTNRIVAIESGIPEKFINHARFETEDQVAMVTDGFGRVRNAPITWIERILSVPEIAFQCRLLRAKGQLDYIVIDYLQLLDLSPYNDRWSKTEKFGQASQDLHDLAEDLDVPIIAMAQLRRAAYEDEIHTGEDMAEAYKFYQDCHVCYTLTPRADKKIVGYLDKNRGGPSRKVVNLFWDNDEHRATLKVREINVGVAPI